MNHLTFPWEPLGMMLRKLSLSGGAGNATAWILFLAAGALPLAAACLLRQRHRAVRADLLLLPLSVSLYAGLWFFINPTYIDHYLSPIPANGAAKYALAAVIDSLLLTWLLLRCIVRCGKLEYDSLLSGLRVLLNLYVTLAAAAVLVRTSAQLIDDCAALKEGNTGSDSFSVGFSMVVLALGATVSLLPALLRLILLLMISGFLKSCGEDVYNENACSRIRRIGRASSRFFSLILIATVGFNVLQLLFSRYILSSHHRIIFPLTELLVVLGIRMFSFLYLEGRRLKEDNDMFI